MGKQVDPDLSYSVQKFGNADWNKCFNCGNCTAICPLTETGFLFPRKGIRAIQLGLKTELYNQIEPWLCYYCGDCSDSCPRDANPGALMMTLRRYLTSLYDWTGLAKKFYTSKIWEFVGLIFVAIIVLILFALFAGPMTTELTSAGAVKINTFAPWKQVHLMDWIMAGVLSFFLISNIFNMWLKVIVFDKRVKVPIYLYFTELWKLIFHFVTQSRFSKCEKSSTYWLLHFLLVTGYAVMFGMIVGFLGWFQTEEIHPFWHPQRLLGYYATLVLTIGLVYFFIGRIKRNKQRNKLSHASDWTFLVLLFLTVITGILVHFFRIYGLPMLTYYTYTIHLMIAVPMLIIEVPFSKWSHLAYRPFAIFFANVKKVALEKQDSS